MKKTILLAAATVLLTGTGAFAQAAMSPAPSGTTMKSTAPKAGAQDMKADSDMKAGAKADASADAAAKPKAHRRMAKNEAALNASEAETTKQLNMEQAQMAQQAR